MKYSDEFGVEFSTKEMAGKVVATVIRIFKRVMSDEDTISINLCEHPLYPKLVQYVKSNPYQPLDKE